MNSALSPSPSAGRRTHEVLCIGGAAIDRTYRTQAGVIAHTSNPASAATGFGGVARNVAATLARLEHGVALMSVLGADEAGQALRADLAALGVEIVPCPGEAGLATAQYVAVLDVSGDLFVGLAAMDAFDALTPDVLEGVWPLAVAGGWVFADCNLPAATLAALVGRKHAIRLVLDTVSVPKAVRLPQDLGGIDLLFTNLDEARALAGPGTPEVLALALRARGAQAVVVTLGDDGCALADAKGARCVGALAARVVDVTGAGDALVAGTLHGLLAGQDLAQAVLTGGRLARLTVETPGTHVCGLCPAMLLPTDNEDART